MSNSIDYRDFHQRESQALLDIGKKFRKSGELSTFDFFTIVIWKANRAKSKVANRLRKGGDIKRKRITHTLDRAVSEISESIYSADTDEERMKVLIAEWGFELPMASAILTILYPKRFTVFDIRVCEQIEKYKFLARKKKWDSLWEGYEDYIKLVKAKTPKNLKSLRDKDRWLWGKSFKEQLDQDITRNFKKKKSGKKKKKAGGKSGS